MLQARSMYLGGELLEATAANYSDSVDLGLTCPVCGKPVFLVKEGVRERLGKLEYISPHFSHYKADSELGKLCEARIQTREGRELLGYLTSESRGQRLSLFNKRLWAMIAWEKDFPKNLDRWIRVHAPMHYGELDRLIDHCWKHWQDPEERRQIKAAIPRAIELLTEENLKRSGVDVDHNRVLVQQAMQFSREALNHRLQWVIAEEVVDYLAQPTAREVFGNLVRLALFDAIPQSLAQGKAIHSNDVQYLILSSIGLTQWVAALEHFKRPLPGEGFSKR